MATIVGDILRLLAAGGINTATNVLGQMLAAPIKEKAERQTLATRALLQSAATAPEEAMPAIQAKLKELVGRDVLPSYQVKTGNVIGPTGESLAITPVPGAPVTPEMVTRFARPAISMSDYLGSAMQQSPELAKRFLGIKTGSEMTAAQEAMAKIARARQETQEAKLLGDLTNKELQLKLQGAKNAADIAKANAELTERMRQFNEIKSQRGLVQDERYQQELLKRIKEARDKALDPDMRPDHAVLQADAHNALVTELHRRYPGQFTGQIPIPIGEEKVGGLFGFGGKMKRRIGGSKELQTEGGIGELPAEGGIGKKGFFGPGRYVGKDGKPVVINNEEEWKRLLQ
jgi:hypothetical protein